MQESILSVLRCPLTRENLHLQIYETETRDYHGKQVVEITSGMLTAPNGYLYPIVKGVPRLQAESFLEHESFIRTHVSDFDARKKTILDKFDYVIRQAIKRNRKTKQSFGLEWSIFDYKKDSTWGWNKPTRKQRFLTELQTTEAQLKGKRLLDVGCGNGVLTSGISEFGMETFGIDVSRSVEAAYVNNDNPNVHYIQGDLQIPPFDNQTFDIVYSTGVIHHTNNTELSFSCISGLTRSGGVLYIWLYKPESDFKHKAMTFTRNITNKLPLRVQYYMYLILLVPQGMLKERMRGKKITWREQLINYMDGLSPEFRYEHTPEEAAVWYVKRSFSAPVVTIREYFGFGLFGIRK